MLVVHHLNNSRSQRVLWLLEELGLEYAIELYERDPRTLLAPPSLRAVHPLGKSPVLTDGELVLAESGAIIEYLVERYGAGRLAPAPGTPEHLRYRYWLHYADGSLMPPLLLKLVFDRMATSPAPFFVRPILRSVSARVKQAVVTPQLRLHLDYLESELNTSDWFAGSQLSGADIQLSFPLEAAVARAGLDPSRPRLWSFLERIHGRAAYQRAIARGGEYSIARS